MGLSDLFILANSGSFSELEQEKSMPSGGILRQCLRLSMNIDLADECLPVLSVHLAMTNAVRHCMECRTQKFDASKTPTTLLTPKGTIKDPLETILELTYLMHTDENDTDNDDIAQLIASFIKNPESVLQELDIQRLRAIIYRDVVRQDRSKSGKNVVVVVVNESILFLCFFSLYLSCAPFVSTGIQKASRKIVSPLG
jgi:hypothetical protein